MAKNIEFKARVDSLAPLREIAAAIADQGPIILNQVDYYFPAKKGRLKLRVINGEESQLIAYQRPDESRPRDSDYLIYSTDEHQKLRDVLRMALGDETVVKKKRELFLCGRTRIHLDEIAELGKFVELEVVMLPGEAQANGQEEINHLMRALGIEQDDIVPGSYLELMDQAALNETFYPRT